jgi:hypothetical protein
VTDAVRAFALTWDGVAERLRSRRELDPDDLVQAVGRGWHALSRGQRKRWQVATALAAAPDVLLLNEPTNHLDGVTLHAGSYAEAAARSRADEAARRAAHERATREEPRLQRQLADARRARGDTERGAAAARRRGTDPEARSMGARFRAQTAERAHAQRVAAVHPRIDRADATRDAVDVARDHTGTVTSRRPPPAGAY